MRELVLTGKAELWPARPETSVFLGDWCFAGNPNGSFLSSGQHVIVPSPWAGADSVDRLAVANEYLDALMNRALDGLAVYFENHYGVKRSSMFWRRLFGVWILHFIGIAFDRFRHLEEAARLNERFQVRTVSGELSFDSLSDNYSFYTRMLSHDYNLALFSEILEHTHFTCFELKRAHDVALYFPGYEDQYGTKQDGPETSFKAAVLRLVPASIVNRYFRLRGKSDSILEFPTDRLTEAEKVELQNEIGVRQPVVYTRRQKPRRKITASRDMTELLREHIKPDNAFEEFLVRRLPEHVPPKYYRLEIEKLPRPRIMIGPGLGLREALNCEAGGKSFVYQHGGGYGHIRVFPLGNVDYRYGTGFVTWGWAGKASGKGPFYDLPDPVLSQLPPSTGASDEIIWISTSTPVYNYRVRSCLLSHQQRDYLLQKVSFAQSLDERIRKRVIFKPYGVDYGVPDFDCLAPFIARENLWSDGSDRAAYFDRLASAKLVIVDHMGTSMLEALSMNCPTVLFWDPKINVEDKQAQPYFNRLRDAGILFDSPAEASAHINDIEDRIGEFWNARSVQRARQEFCNVYAKADPHWKRDWIKFITDQIATMQTPDG